MRVLDHQTYLGQAVPYHYVERSATAMAGVLGAEMELVNKDTTWATPCFTHVEQVAELVVDRSNTWYRKAIEITRRSVALAPNHHFVASYALGGMTDILAGLYGTENLLVDMIAKPQAVARAMERVKRIWIELFHEVHAIIAGGDAGGGNPGAGNPGAVGWAGIWAPGTTFPLQEDSSYMISNEMFRQFCLPHLLDQMAAMDCPFYHLDGVGALNHLETLLQIDALKAIQWVPGAGKERLDQWYGVIRRILAANKSVQVYGDADEVDGLVANVGARGLLITVRATREQAEQLMGRYGG
jgi:hypothetical protein